MPNIRDSRTFFFVFFFYFNCLISNIRDSRTFFFLFIFLFFSPSFFLVFFNNVL